MKSHKEFKPTLAQLGDRIYHRRVLKNFTAKEVAYRIQLSTEAYRNIERGESDPSFTTLLMITKILEMNSSELINNL